MKEYAVIVAGGAGKRMGTRIPKQFLLLSGKPVLMHTVDVFYRYDSDIRIILVLPEEMIPYWQSLCNKFSFSIPHQIAEGGATRFQSVKNGLKKIPDPEVLVAIHDGVRPLVSTGIIRSSFRSAEKFGSGITVVNLRESLRQVDQNKNRAVSRADYRLVQTPQTFQLDLIRHAYDMEEKESALLTDDAIVAEKAGISVHLVEGSYENIKITSKNDLLIAEAIFSSRNKKSGM
jgi:2-C-methyl-D-erythritol 4-phosphate cytidylyltransferase